MLVFRRIPADIFIEFCCFTVEEDLQIRKIMIARIDTNTLISYALADQRHMEFTADDGRTADLQRTTAFMGTLPKNMMHPHYLDADIHYVKQSGFLYQVEEEIRCALLFPIVICRSLYPPSHYTKRSEWPLYQLIYTHSGKGMLNIRDHFYPLRPGTFCLIDCRQYHYFYADCPDGWEYSFIHYDGPGARLLFQAATESSVVWDNMHDSPARKIYGQLFKLNEYNGPDFDLRFHKLMTDLLYELIKTNSGTPQDHMRTPEWLGSTQTYIHEHFNESLTIEELADMAHLSTSQFSHRFKSFIGLAPIQYQYRVRINQALTYLSGSDLPIEQISEMIGFHNMANFYAVFRSMTGETPARYRRRQKSADENN